jgi:hypothetical protein
MKIDAVESRIPAIIQRDDQFKKPHFGRIGQVIIVDFDEANTSASI